MKVSIYFGALILVLVVLVPSVHPFPNDYHAPAFYSYGYGVKDPYTYADFGQEETRTGDNTKGQYSVLLPDGRRQVVTYYVNGDSGFVADVKYIGEAKYSKKPPHQQY